MKILKLNYLFFALLGIMCLSCNKDLEEDYEDESFTETEDKIEIDLSKSYFHNGEQLFDEEVIREKLSQSVHTYEDGKKIQIHVTDEERDEFLAVLDKSIGIAKSTQWERRKVHYHLYKNRLFRGVDRVHGRGNANYSNFTGRRVWHATSHKTMRLVNLFDYTRTVKFYNYDNQVVKTCQLRPHRGCNFTDGTNNKAYRHQIF